MSDRPLVSYCVKCYNQERYIGEALRAAFAQTYEPLEILICDDASTDRSDEIIRTMVRDYQASGGKHIVRYYRNEKNLGNLGNWQHICELAEGELMVKADGDDYSTPDRTAELVSAWVSDNKRATYLYSDGVAVSESGRSLWNVDLREDYCIGAFEAYSKSCFSMFGPTERTLAHEGADDVVYLSRAKMLGQGIHVPARLVYYRQGSGETSAGLNYVRMQTRGFRFMLASAKQLIHDVEYVRNQLGESRYAKFRQRYEWSVRHHQALLDLWLGKTYVERKRGYRILMELKSFPKTMGVFLLLPTKFAHPLLCSVFSVNYWLKRYRVR